MPTLNILTLKCLNMLELLVPVDADHTVFAYIFEGAASFDENSEDLLQAGIGVLFGHGDQVVAKTGTSKARFILIAGKPIKESIAWQGPIVMNTQQELSLAFKELREGTFIKKS